ncbi:hypothetical protein NPIL_395921, partial [Nephila pilipes]
MKNGVWGKGRACNRYGSRELPNFVKGTVLSFSELNIWSVSDRSTDLILSYFIETKSTDLTTDRSSTMTNVILPFLMSMLLGRSIDLTTYTISGTNVYDDADYDE